MVLSKCAKSSAAGAAALALLSCGVSADCPANLPAYSDEANPFGWPVTAAQFQYEKAECWPEKYQRCGGARQSPMMLESGSGAGCTFRNLGGDGNLKGRGSYGILAGRPGLSVSKYLRGISLAQASSVAGKLGSIILEGADGKPVEYEAVDAILTTGLHSIQHDMPDAELLIVHKPKGTNDAFAGRVVISVIFSKAADPSGFSDLFDQMGLGEGQAPEVGTWRAPKSLDFRLLMASAMEGASLAYDGSMPMPPCVENVRYIILTSPQQVSAAQIESLDATLDRFVGGSDQRPPVPRMVSGICERAIDQNSAQVPPIDLSSWSNTCGKSPIDINSEEADHSVAAQSAANFLNYLPAKDVVMTPTKYTLDAVGHFGGIIVNGRRFEATKVSLKAVSSHSFDGTRYAAELLVEHVLFGDALAAVAAAEHSEEPDSTAHSEEPDSTAHEAAADHAVDDHDLSDHHVPPHGRRLETESPADDHAAAPGTHVVDRLHRVVVSIPLTLGRESPLLRSMGLGVSAFKDAIRNGDSFTVESSIDLQKGLKASTAGSWYWYGGSTTLPGTCPEFGIRWMVFEQPMEMSLQQLNSLALPVSGLDSALPPVAIDQQHVSASFVPTKSVENEKYDSKDHYADTSDWRLQSPTCAGKSQSPINIQSSAVSKVGNQSFLTKASWKPLLGLKVHNDGYKLGFETNQMGYSTLMGHDGYPKYYQVTEVALRMPSEHLLNGHQYAAEFQVIQKNQKTVLEYDDDDVLITSFFFELGEEENKLVKQLIPEQIPAEGKSSAVQRPADLQWALGPVLDGPFFSYNGSYTSPDDACSEGVQWVVFSTPMSISLEQATDFRAAFPHGNNRPVQALNGRKVLQNDLGEGEPIDFRYFLNRKFGRDKAETPIRYIAFPIIGTLILCAISMTAIFQREDAETKSTSAGGLEGEAIGKGSYGKL